MLKKMLAFLSILLIDFNLNCVSESSISNKNVNNVLDALREIDFCIVNKSDKVGSYFWASPGRSRDESEKSRTRIMVIHYNNLMNALGLPTIPLVLIGMLGGTHYDISQIDMSFIDKVKEQLNSFLESQDGTDLVSLTTSTAALTIK